MTNPLDTPNGSPSHATEGNSAQAPLQDLKDAAQDKLQDVKQQGSAHYEQYRDTAADQLEVIAQSAQSAADELGEKDTLGLAHYVSDMAQSLTGLAGDLRGKSAEQLLHQAGTLARDNPALFLTGSIAIGFGLSRFLKASSQPDTGSDQHISDSSQHVSGPDELLSMATPAVAAENELVEPAAGADVIHTGNIPKGPDVHTPTATRGGDPIGAAAIDPAHGDGSLTTGSAASPLDRPTLSGGIRP